MDRSAYIGELEKEVENNESYMKTTDSQQKQVDRNVKKLVSKMYKEGSDKTEI